MTRSPDLLLLGHRGARAASHIPENTAASFELCLEHGCAGFEFDVRRSADGQAVVCHDATTHGINIAETEAKDLNLPTLEAVLRQFSARAFLDIELKVVGLEAQTLAALRAFPPQKEYVVSSFLPEVLTGLHTLDASLPLGLVCKTREQLIHWRDLPATWVIPRMDLMDQALVEDLHTAGKKVMVWTVNEAVEMRQLAEWGANALISDETELAPRTVGQSTFPLGRFKTAHLP
jgi:glycerophosphoryl diester phosphodiesterase